MVRQRQKEVTSMKARRYELTDEVAAAVRLRITGFGEGYCQQDSDGTE